MNIRIKLKTFCSVAIAAMIAVGCVNESDVATPEIKKIAQVTNADFTYLTTNKPTQIGAQVVLTEDKTIAAYVVSSDQEQNFYKNLQVVSEDGKVGAQISIDKSGSFQNFPLGSKVYIKTKGLSIANTFGMIELGMAGNGQITRIPDAQIRDFVQTGETSISEDKVVQTKNDAGNALTLKDLNDSYLNKLVEIDGVEFSSGVAGKTYFNPKSQIGGGTDNYINDATSVLKIDVRISSYANFGKQTIPYQNGKIRGVLTKYNSTYQLIIRDTKDVNLSKPRQSFEFNNAVTGSLVTIKSIRDVLNTTITNDVYVQGKIILSNLNYSNTSNRNLYIQDETGGLQIRMDTGAHTMYEGNEVRINLKGIAVSRFSNGPIQIGEINQKQRIQMINNTDVMPTVKTITVADLVTQNYESQYVKIEGLQYKVATDNFGAAKTLTDCTTDIPTFTVTGSFAATFANDPVPQGKGTFVGIASTFNSKAQLLVRDPAELNMTGTRCP